MKAALQLNIAHQGNQFSALPVGGREGLHLQINEEKEKASRYSGDMLYLCKDALPFAFNAQIRGAHARSDCHFASMHLYGMPKRSKHLLRL